MSNPYDWNDIRAILKEALSNTESFALFARIGSDNVTRDIDVVSVKKPTAASARFLEEIHHVLDTLEHELQTRYDQKLVRFSRFSHEDAIKHIAQFEDGDLAFHLMNYRSMPELVQNWNADVVLGEDPRKILTENDSLEVLAGNIQDAVDNTQTLSHGALFQYIERRDRIHSHFPHDLLIQSTNELLYYLKKRLGTTRTINAHTPAQARRAMYEFAELIEAQEH